MPRLTPCTLACLQLKALMPNREARGSFVILSCHLHIRPRMAGC